MRLDERRTTKDERKAIPLISKAGVSLVTVLLFMLVATIAATATFKWLTSEGRSSGSRMQKQEAYQSAMAGIQNARAWMTYSANDVGALIKQFRDEGKMIKLNSRLTPWLRANQKYDVWLAGVNTSAAHNFKLKILSSGKSTGNAVHNEVAIFNVDGLYQVQIPQEVVGINFDKAFDGKTTGVTGSDTMQSGIIHGDFTDQNNTPKLTGNFIISGDMGFGGHIHGDGDMYVKGSITSKNGGYTFGTKRYNPPFSHELDTNVVYVGGDIACADNQPIRVYGDLYVGGSISEKCAIDVSGNLTIGGSIERTNNAAKMFTIGKNLVFKPDAIFHWTTTIGYGIDAQSGTGVGENTYLAKLTGSKNSDGNRKINLGKKIYLYQNPGYVNCPNKDNPGGFRPDNCNYCEGFFTTCSGTGDEMGSNVNDRYFSFYNKRGPHEGGGELAGYTSIVAPERIVEWAKTDNVLGKANANYWKNISKMNAYGNIIKNDGTIPQAIFLKDSALWMAKATENVSKCGLSAQWIMNDAAVKKLNECYIAAKDGNWLYNGILPVEWKYKENGVCNGEKLKGKFLIYASESVGNTDLPPTTNDAVVMFYFRRGVSGQLKGNHSGHRDWVYNYFMYSSADIKELWNFNLKGSVVMSNGTTLQKYQGSNKLEFKSDVLNFLASAGVIMENPEFTALAGGADPSHGGLEAGAGASYDSYFIAAAPQLNITLESQYENNEPLPADGDQQEITSSFIVLPRVIYLPKDPYGKLEDYFNVVNLNGGTLTKDVAKVTGCTGIPKSGVLYDRSASTPTVLPAGIHECHYQDGGKDIPFYIFVSNDELGNKPQVWFETGNIDMGATSTQESKLVCKAAPTGGMEFTVKVSKPTLADNTWQIITEATAEAGSCGSSDAFCLFKISSNAECSETNPKTLFTVKTVGATEGTYTFQLLDCVGCQIASPSSETFMVSSAVTIMRNDLAEYCNLPGVNCDATLLAQANTAQWPDCNAQGVGPWVKAVGFNSSTTNNCAAITNNEMWGCGATSDIKLELIENAVPNTCVAVIPDGEKNVLSQSELVTGDSYPLYASLKAKKVSFHVGFAGSNYAGKTITVSSNRFNADRYCTPTSEPSDCTYDLFAGDEVTVTLTGTNKEEFSYWKCNEGSTNCTVNETFSSATYTINQVGGDNSISAWFGQKDKHCFFDEFQSTRECTGTGTDWKYCFSYCKSEGDCKIGNEYTAQAKWIVLGPVDLRNKLDYDEGKIWLNYSYNRHKKQADVEALMVLSTVQAGYYGSLRAQFQVPRLGRESDESSARVNKSGFLLRSNDDATNYIMLNVFANKEGNLAAKVCIDNSCRSETMSSLVQGTMSVSSTDVITMTAEISKEGARDILFVTAVKGGYGNYRTVTARFDLSSIDGFMGLSSSVNERVGFSLADPDFKVYDIGWKSETYNAECWQTYPTVKCSFRAAYLGGIVPQNQPTKPWVGLSSWFDEKGCEPQYFYNGNDACGSYTDDDGYSECVASDYYKFTTGGQHGTIDEQTVGSEVREIETKMAKAKIKECRNTYLSQNDRALLYAEEARCGEFWVGAVNPCSRNEIIFPLSSTSTTIETSRAIAPHVDDDPPSEFLVTELFATPSDAVVNLRDAVIKITMNNPNASELEIYLRSSRTENAYYGHNVSYSASAVTKAMTSATISVEELANRSGFDPEHVTGVIIRNHGTSNVTITEIKSVCDNVMSIQCKDVQYAGDKFKANAVVKHAEDVGSYTVTGAENSSHLAALDSTNCEDGTGCPLSDEYGRINLYSKTYNPYSTEFTEAKSYVFTVHMLDADGHDVEGSPCTTSPALVLHPLSGECKWSSTNTKPSVQQGKGLPDFQYKLADCAGGNCEWEIMLDGTTQLKEGEGTVGGFNSLPIDVRTGNNSEAAPLATGDHKIRFRSKSTSTTQFNECEMTFEVIDANSGTGNLTCSMPSQAIPGTQMSNLSIYSSLPAQNFDVYFNNVKGHDNLYVNNGQNSFNYVSVPNTVGTYTYKITKDGSTEAECSGTIDVVNPLVCSIKDEVKLNVQNTFQVSTLSGFRCDNCTYSNNLSCGNSCGNAVGNKTFTMTNSTPMTLSVTCQCSNKQMTCSETAVSEVVAPDVTCSGTINAEPGTSVSFTPTALTGCEGGCKYWINSNLGNLVKDTATISSASSVAFIGENKSGENGYTLYVKNNKGSDNCSITVDYKKPTFTCPADMEQAVESEVSIRPTNVSYCTQGCSYTITGGTFTDNSTSGQGYVSGNLPKKIAGETSESSGDGTTYTLKLTNPAGDNSPACSFKIKYVSNSSVVCGVSGTNAVTTTCSFSNNDSIQPGANANFKATIYQNGGVDIRNHNYELRTVGCQVVKDGSTGGNGEMSFDINGTSVATSSTFVLYVEHDGEYLASCAANIKVKKISPTCSKITESSTDKFKVTFKQPCTNSACVWKLMKESGGTSTEVTHDYVQNGEYKIDLQGSGRYYLLINDEDVDCSIDY